MEKNPEVKNLAAIKIVSRPQESCSCTTIKSASEYKNMGLSIVQALILILISKKLFIWQSISNELLAIPASMTFSSAKREK